MPSPEKLIQCGVLVNPCPDFPIDWKHCRMKRVSFLLCCLKLCRIWSEWMTRCLRVPLGKLRHMVHHCLFPILKLSNRHTAVIHSAVDFHCVFSFLLFGYADLCIFYHIFLIISNQLQFFVLFFCIYTSSKYNKHII